jgi:hypothetical protein
MSSKVTNNDQIFALAYKVKFFFAYHNEQNQTSRKKTTKLCPKRELFEFFTLVPGCLSMEPLWYKIGENRRDKKISHSGTFNRERKLKEERSEAKFMNVHFY